MTANHFELGRTHSSSVAIVMDTGSAVKCLGFAELSKSAIVFDDVFARFRDCHDRCAGKKHLTAKLDCLAVNLRDFANKGATLVEQGSSEWCGNSILLCDCIGEPEEGELRRKVVKSSKSMSDGFERTADYCHNIVSEIHKSIIGKVFSSETAQAKDAVNSTMGAITSHKSRFGQEDPQDDKETKKNGLLSMIVWGREERPNNSTKRALKESKFSTVCVYVWNQCVQHCIQLLAIFCSCVL